MTDGHAESSDEMLMVRYKRGDRAAFAELVRRYQKPLFNFSLLCVSRRDIASRITQDAFLRLVKRSADFKHESRFSTWIFAITRNLCTDELQHAKHHKPNRPDEEVLAPDCPSDQRAHTNLPTDAERTTVDQSFRQGIIEAIKNLPGDQKEVFLMRELGGVPFAEIAKITSTSENTVKDRVRWALEGIQKQLSTYSEHVRPLR